MSGKIKILLNKLDTRVGNKGCYKGAYGSCQCGVCKGIAPSSKYLPIGNTYRTKIERSLKGVPHKINAVVDAMDGKQYVEYTW